MNSRQNAEKLIAEYQPQFQSFIRKRVTNKEDADDILQDVFYQLVRALDNAMNPIEQVSAWLYRVTRNMITNKKVKRREEPLPTYQEGDDEEEVMKDFSKVLFGGEAASPETEYLRSLVWEELEVALAELPLEQREIFEQTEIDGLPVKEISEATGVSVNTLLSRKHYAVQHLRKRLAVLYDELTGS
ncbi:MAG: sigma-70 family RNA polymerase sigma factor [Prevotellaceae bacterium]|jgi:RNA polymerase sigma factor (sigma-70 family)|nr:sigma-70 family RNA polymerase sigma factor [Prevotellaceae bacterium]